MHVYAQVIEPFVLGFERNPKLLTGLEFTNEARLACLHLSCSRIMGMHLHLSFAVWVLDLNCLADSLRA